jgi:hypothetical protein
MMTYINRGEPCAPDFNASETLVNLHRGVKACVSGPTYTPVSSHTILRGTVNHSTKCSSRSSALTGCTPSAEPPSASERPLICIAKALVYIAGVCELRVNRQTAACYECKASGILRPACSHDLRSVAFDTKGAPCRLKRVARGSRRT